MKSWISFASLVLICLNLAACTRSQTRDVELYSSDEWTILETENFSLSLPKSVKGGKEPGVDTSLWGYRNESFTIDIEFGFQSFVPSSVRQEKNYREAEISIDNRKAKIITFDRSTDNKRSDLAGKNKVMIIFARDVDGIGNNMKCWFYYVDQSTNEARLKGIVESIKFK